jgi:hypothetical protein
MIANHPDSGDFRGWGKAGCYATKQQEQQQQQQGSKGKQGWIDMQQQQQLCFLCYDAVRVNQQHHSTEKKMTSSVREHPRGAGGAHQH